MKFPIPSALRFFFLLLTYLSYVGAFYLYRGNSKYKMLWVFLAFLPTFLNATQSTIFIEMFLWGGFIIIMYTYFNRSSHFVKSGLITVSVLVVVLISTVKSEYREIFYVDEEVNNTVLQNANQANALVGLINKRLEDKSASSDESGQVFVDRLNQGWIIARVMNAVPEYVPFADGETIKDGIYAALLPRVLAPNKQVAGGVTNFERFTGLTLKFTSMNLGIVGEAYANYGERGGIIFMFFYGLLFNLALHLVRSKAVKSEEYLLWIPFLFLCTVKAEDDFGTSLNYFTKSALVMFLFLWITNKVLSIKKENT